MNHLEAAGLLFAKTEVRTSFPGVRKGLNLSINEEIDQDDDLPRDISHVYWGYAPISIRLVELTLRPQRMTFSRKNVQNGIL